MLRNRKGYSDSARRWLSAWSVVLGLLGTLGAHSANANAFAARGPAAQDPVLADSAEIFTLTAGAGSERWFGETWDCPDAAGNAAGIAGGCTLGGPRLAVSGSVVGGTVGFGSLQRQVASVAGSFRSTESEVAFAAGGSAVGGAAVELFLCSDLTTAAPCDGGSVIGSFAASAVVDVFGPDGFPSRRLVQIAAAQLDDDPLDELVVAWWNDQFAISITVFEWDPETGVQSRYDVAVPDQPVLPTSLFRSAAFGLDGVDFDGDLIDAIAVVAPNQPSQMVQASDFENFTVSFFELVRNATACGGPARCLQARGEDTFEEHRLPGDGDHLGLYYPAGQGRSQGCNPAAPNCFLEKVVAKSARLTAQANATPACLESSCAALDSGLAESLVVALRYSYENGDGGGFRENTTDVVLLNPERAADEVNVELGVFDSCTPSGGGSVFAAETVCLEADPTDPSQGINGVLLHLPLFYIDSSQFPSFAPLCVAAGNVAGSALDEVAVVRGDRLELLQGARAGDGKPLALQGLSPNIVLHDFSGITLVQFECDVAMMDMDAQLGDQSADLATWQREIVVSQAVLFFRSGFLGGWEQARFIEPVKVNRDANGDFVSLAIHASQVADSFSVGPPGGPLTPLNPFTSAFPDADNDRVSLDEPNIILSRTVEQPTLLLSAPPRHLDVIDEFPVDAECVTAPGGVVDINWTGCLATGDCRGFESYYRNVDDNNYSSEITNEVTRSIGGGFSFAGFGASVERTFTDTSVMSSETTVTVSQGSSAFFEDVAQVRSTGYRIYEYPVLQGGGPIMSGAGKPLTVLLTRTVPSSVAERPADEVDLVLPTHVPGNLLSYKPMSWFTDPTRCGGTVNCTVGSPGMTMDIPFFETQLNFSMGFWQIDTETSAGQSATQKGSLAVSAGGSGTYKGLTVSVQGDYESVETSSHSTSVTAQTGLGWSYMDQSSTNPAFRYQATPIVMIDELGTLTLDFAVDIIPDSCLDQVYGSSGRSDPALALPLRRQVGQQSVSNAQQDLRTKEISCRFDPTTGDYELTTRVHNYSLVDTGASVPVDFYVGDPRDGGALVGQTATVAGIAAQDTGDNEDDVSLFVGAGCDGAGSVDQGSACIADADCRAADEEEGACIAMLASPYDVCAADAGVLEGDRCNADVDCRTSPGDLSGSCIPETRVFVRLDSANAIAEVSEDNNLGWAQLAGRCAPTIPVPEPGSSVAFMVAAGTLATMRRRRAHSGKATCRR